MFFEWILRKGCGINRRGYQGADNDDESSLHRVVDTASAVFPRRSGHSAQKKARGSTTAGILTLVTASPRSKTGRVLAARA